MINLISVIIPTYNPDLKILDQTLYALQNQTLDLSLWELIIVDNGSVPDVRLNLNWHPQYTLIKSPDPGLTYARVKGFEHSKGDLVIMVDDDNVLNKDYLQCARQLFDSNLMLGAAGGKSLPEFEKIPPDWLKDFHSNLAVRDLGDSTEISSWNNTYPACAPIGAGMCVRKAAVASYVNKIHTGMSIITDRKGDALSSGGDNDLVVDILKSGWQVGYFPELVLRHIIPGKRMQPGYMANLVNSSNKSWVQLLDSHQINPWKKIPRWTVPIRKMKAWIACKSWQNKSNYIRWRGICGMYDGLAR
ncbi:glycosyltransferase [Mucilaginibacter sabulilitoris]|uniref:Glycosyltransferase n=1 Tax=Mucilaginibacter sabulilitoris TaxID=1173583 RepID=A0ABZ0TEN9_9SPHI|nr:glycosyltransferase [Mucilaginibacter sabulilitoris]WPU91650.1 glycosyltransferase [Mucilaginibacter sabulilitoris]